jgi:hypothetical protein
LGVVVVLCFSVVGCGGGSADQATIAQGRMSAGCGGAMAGPGAGDWRPDATAAGRFGVYGTGRDFRTAQKAPVRGFRGLQQRQVSGPVLTTKTPFVVEGREPIEVAISLGDRPRAGLVAGVPFGGGPYAEIRFVPCRDQPRTWWPGGWVLRDQGQVTISVRPVNEPESQLVVGRP